MSADDLARRAMLLRGLLEVPEPDRHMAERCITVRELLDPRYRPSEELAAVAAGQSWGEYAARKAFSAVQSERGRKGARISHIVQSVDRAQRRRREGN